MGGLLILLGGRAVAWIQGEVEAWIGGKIEKRNNIV
jgi:predicted DNA-binding transcriptional regulator AlpA